MELHEATMLELKASYYDALVLQQQAEQRAQRALSAINAEIMRRVQEGTNAPRIVLPGDDGQV
jgi:hypothetical protein